ncbi:LysR family transcriptional regulator [Kibdelosporangium phytohabitans]|uniref:LysR family transcriptional regulator n=1 Tax=Kibdelosporangium phytohabitans TaxID=860235 RepID=A0A0N9IEX6_9PSEU|nr:LysR family transcriptional regulator [Kibdelosporangium phytohabitans]ALG13985.1 LysR family transcriptional regulator [Kibdelosporangium phytohabitans]MBE1467062.1 DNA-binding transcriptional LysR family regulator [Kibdelosporangium phytohabitans]
MPEPEIRELRYFQAVAEELNITKAARRLGIAQPPLSRAIRQLERRVGVDLFDRRDHGLALTDAGEVLHKEAIVVLNALGHAVRQTRRAGLATLVVTAKPGVATGLLHRVCERFRAEPDTPEIQVVVSGFGEQADMVRDGRADVAIAACVDGRGLATELLASEPRVAALPSGHMLASRDVLSTADLLTEPAPRWSDPRVVDRDYWLGHPDRPADGPVVHDSAQLLEVVALGQAVALVPSSLAARNIRPDVVYRPVPDAAPYRTSALWSVRRRSPWIGRFVQTAKAQASPSVQCGRGSG